MVINMSELFSADGISKTYEVMPDLRSFSWRRQQYPVSCKQPVSIKLMHEGNRKVAITATAMLSLEIPCDHCLETVEVLMELIIDREVDANATAQERIAQLDEQSYMDGYNLDVDQLLQEELMLNMPSKVLCKEDCKGVCPRCGVNLNYETCSCETEDLDPRMSIIRDIFN